MGATPLSIVVRGPTMLAGTGQSQALRHHGPGGWQLVRGLRSSRRAEAQHGAVRPLLVLLLLVVLPVGLWAWALPGSFYEQFPGFGHAWVSGDGPYNEHLLRDVGSLYLALAIVLAYALVSPSRELVRPVALATLVASVLHFAYHAVHLDLLPSGADAAMQTLALAVPIVAAVALLRASSPRRSARGAANGDAEVRTVQAVDVPTVPTHG
jgi:hypothetical protein